MNESATRPAGRRCRKGEFGLLAAGFLIFGLVTILGDAQLARVIFKQIQTSTFARVPGVVLSSKTVVSSEGDGESPSAYLPVVSYRYTVAGTEYECSRYSYEWQGAAGTWAKNIVARHPKGTPVTVLYNPANPEDAVLEYSSAISLESLLMLLPFNLMFFLVLRRAYQLWRKNPDVPCGVTVVSNGPPLRVYFEEGISPLGAASFLWIFANGIIIVIATHSELSASWPGMGCLALTSLTILFLLNRGLAHKFRRTRRELIIDTVAQTLTIRANLDGSRPAQIPISKVKEVDIELESASEGKSEKHIAILRIDEDGVDHTQRLNDWFDRGEAETFVYWLDKQLGL